MISTFLAHCTHISAFFWKIFNLIVKKPCNYHFLALQKYGLGAERRRQKNAKQSIDYKCFFLVYDNMKIDGI